MANLRPSFDNRFLRFIAVGVLNSVFGYGCFVLFLYLGLHYSVAMLLATVLGVLFNFKSTGTLVFGSHNNRLISKFVASYVVVYVFNILGIRMFSEAGISPSLSGAIMLFPMAVLAFLLNKRFVFNNA